jgi:hypothetical protein
MKILGINQFRIPTKRLSQVVVDVKVHKILFHDNFVIFDTLFHRREQTRMINYLQEELSFKTLSYH